MRVMKKYETLRLNGADIGCDNNGIARCEIETAGIKTVYELKKCSFDPAAKVVFTDLDGTSVQSEEFWIYLIEKTARAAAKNNKLRLCEEDIPFVSGFSTLQHLSYVIEKYHIGCGVYEANRIYHQIAKAELSEILAGRGNVSAMKPRAGLKDFLLEIKGAGVKIGLVTSGLAYKAIPEIAGAFRLMKMGDPLDFYDAIITGGFRKEKGVYGTAGELCSKPHPWVYAEIGAALCGNLPCEKAITLEDSAAGVIASRLAGYSVLGFSDGNIVKSNADFLCEKIVDDFETAAKIILNK